MMRCDDFCEFMQRQVAGFYDSKSWNETELSADEWFQTFCEYLEIPDESPPSSL